eukprot:12418865-Ditylum_brightwellii.AAC.1
MTTAMRNKAFITKQVCLRLIAKVTNSPLPVTLWLAQYHGPCMQQEGIVCKKSLDAIIKKALPSSIAAMKAKTRSKLPAAAL